VSQSGKSDTPALVAHAMQPLTMPKRQAEAGFKAEMMPNYPVAFELETN